MKKLANSNTLFYLLFGTIIVLVPSFILRINHSLSILFYNKFGTYLGDLWNFFTNYLGKGLHFPPEYPVGIRFIYEIFHLDQIKTLTNFFTVNTIILIVCALITTYFLYLIVKDGHKRFSSIWYYWILAPSFIVYSLYNYDLPAVMFSVLAYYFFTKNKYTYSAVSLALGTVIKFFPIYLLPLFIINSPKGKRIQYFFIYSIVVILINLPYAMSDFSTWSYPYLWQITHNLSHSAKEQTYWWILYPYFGKYLGILSLAVFVSLYTYVAYRLKDKSLVIQMVAVLILFLLTDRIYSPQYNLYLLPFFVTLPYLVNKPIFYLWELLNVTIIIFLFKLTDNLVLLQSIVFIRYFLLIILFTINYKKAFKDTNYAPPRRCGIPSPPTCKK